MELRHCHKLCFSNSYNFALKFRRPELFQTMNSVRSINHSFKYQRLKPAGCKDIGIRTSEFVTKTQFLYVNRKNHETSRSVQMFSDDIAIEIQIKGFSFISQLFTIRSFYNVLHEVVKL